MNWTCSSRHLLCAVSIVFLSTLCVAAEESRTWTDASGKFSVEAKLLEFKNGEAILLTNDGRKLTLQADVLSNTDQAYLKNMADNPFSGGEKVSDEPTGLFAKSYEIAELPTVGKRVLLTETQLPDPMTIKESLQLPTFEVFAQKISKQDAYAKCSAPILIDSSPPRYAVSECREENAVAPDQFGRIYLVNSKSTKPELAVDLPGTLILLDHHIESGRTLAIVNVEGSTLRGGDLVLLEGVAESTPKGVSKWHLPGWNQRGFKPKVEFARLLDKDRAIVQLNRDMYVWNLGNGKCEFLFSDLTSTVPEISPDRRLLILPGRSSASLIDLTTGKSLGEIPIAANLKPEGKFSPDGKQLVLVSGKQFVVWDLPSGEFAQQGSFEGVPGKLYGWVASDLVLTQLQGIVDVKNNAVLWRYSLPSSEGMLTMPGGIMLVSNDYATQSKTFFALPVPHPPVVQIRDQLDDASEDSLAIGPGSEVALLIEAGSEFDREEIRESLSIAAVRAGWKINPFSRTVLTATISYGSPIKLPIPVFNPRSEPNQSPQSITPCLLGMKLKHDSDLIWSRSAESIGGASKSANKDAPLDEKFRTPDPERIANTQLPTKILKQGFNQRAGRSSLRNGNWHDY